MIIEYVMISFEGLKCVDYYCKYCDDSYLIYVMIFKKLKSSLFFLGGSFGGGFLLGGGVSGSW